MSQSTIRHSCIKVKGLPFIKVRVAAAALAGFCQLHSGLCASNYREQNIAVIPLLSESTFSKQHLFPSAHSPL